MIVISNNKTVVFLFFLFLIVLIPVGLDARDGDHVVGGQVICAGKKEPVPYINVTIEGTEIGASTDDDGQYELKGLSSGSHRLLVRGLGYVTQYKDIEIGGAHKLAVDIELYPDIIELRTFVITASPTASGFRYQSDLAYFGESLQRRGEASFGEMLDGEPGLAMRSMGSAPARPVIRGMDGDRILILEHGERMGDVSESGAGHSLAMDPLSASRVEVVKGPASLLYGSSALGGVINLMTADIPEDWDMGSSGVVSGQGASVNNMGAGFVRYTYGNTDWATTGRMAFRGAGDIRTPEGAMPGTYMDNYDAAVGFGVKREHLKGGISISGNSQVYGLPEHMDDPYESVEVRQQRYGLQGRFAFDRQGFFDKTQWRFQATHLNQNEVEIETEDENIHEDIELSHYKYAFSTTVTLQHRPAGIFDRGAIGINVHGHNLEIGGDEAYTPGERRGNAGVFIYQEIPLSARWRLQAGIRADAQYAAALPNHVFPDAGGSRSSLNFTGSAGLNYRPADGVEVGGQFARSHRNPMVEELFADGPHLCSGVYELGNTELKDEVGHGADLFFEWQGKMITFELAGFYNHYRNFIIFEPTGRTDDRSLLPVFHYTEDKARFFGGELASHIRLTDQVQLGMSLDYVNARRTEGEKDHLPFIPPFRMRTHIEYSAGNAWIGANIRAVARQENVAANELSTGGYTLLGMTAGYRIDYRGRHVLIFRCDNMLNTKYRDHLSRVEDRQFPMPGRNLNLAYRFYF